MNPVNDKVQKLFSEYENLAHNEQQSRRADGYENQDDLLSEIQTLREAWNRLGWEWEDRDIERQPAGTFEILPVDLQVSPPKSFAEGGSVSTSYKQVRRTSPDCSWANRAPTTEG